VFEFTTGWAVINWETCKIRRVSWASHTHSHPRHKDGSLVKKELPGWLTLGCKICFLDK
jgi:hypothetical protein